MADLCGVINVYKEKDYTSHDVVAIARKILGGAKTGHTGTLDPQAEGVLPLCVGKATKLAERLAAQVKGYRAVVNLGVETDTQDFTGTVLSRRAVTASEREVRDVVASFLGERMQTPPMYSAVKVGGRRLYELARAGLEVERKQRKIIIYEISVLSFLPGDCFVMDVLCSKGTYIRSLCASIGEALGCGAHMGELLRTRSGEFYLEQSRKLDEIRRLDGEGRLEEILLPVDKVLPGCKKAVVAEYGEKHLYNGNKMDLNLLESGLEGVGSDDDVLLYDRKGRLAGLYNLRTSGAEAYLKPVTMFL